MKQTLRNSIIYVFRCYCFTRMRIPYPTKYCFTLFDLYDNDPVNTLTLSRKKYCKEHGVLKRHYSIQLSCNDVFQPGSYIIFYSSLNVKTALH